MDFDLTKNLERLRAHELVKLDPTFERVELAGRFDAIEASLKFGADQVRAAKAKAERIAKVESDPDLTGEAKMRRRSEIVAGATDEIKAHFAKRLGNLRAGLVKLEEELRQVPGGDPASSAVAEIARQFRLYDILDELRGMNVGERLSVLQTAIDSGDALPFVAIRLGLVPLIPQEEHFQIFLEALNKKVRPDVVERSQNVREVLEAESLLAGMLENRIPQIIAAAATKQQSPAEVAGLERQLGEWVPVVGVGLPT